MAKNALRLGIGLASFGLAVLTHLSTPAAEALPERQVVTEDLAREIGVAVKSGEKPRVWVSIFGKKAEYLAVGADAKSLSVLVQNNPMPLGWSMMNGEELVTVAKSFAGTQGKRLFLAGRVAAAVGQREAAVDLLGQARASDSDLAEAVQNLLAGLGETLPASSQLGKTLPASAAGRGASGPGAPSPPASGGGAALPAAAVLNALPAVGIRVEEAAGVLRPAWPLTFGVPFAPGQLRETGALLLSGNGKALPIHAEPAARWKDGSIKWLHVDAQADLPAQGAADLKLHWNAKEKSPAPAVRLTVTPAGEGVQVDTGAIAFLLTPSGGGIPEQVRLGNKTLVSGGGQHTLAFLESGPALNPPETRGNWKRPAPAGATPIALAAKGPTAKVSIEQQNGLRTTIKVSGWYEGGGRKACRYDVRVTAFAGKPYVRLHHTFTFTEDPAKCFIRNIGLRFQVDGAAQAFFGGEGQTVHKADASKGAHLLAVGPAIQHNGIKVGDAAQKKVTYTVVENGGGSPAVTGQEPWGYGAALGKQGGVSVGVRDLRQLHPKELSADAAGLTAWLWPEHGDLVIDCRNSGYGEVIRGETTLGGVATGWAKTHELWACYHGADAAGKKLGEEVARAAQEPAWAAVDPRHVCESGAMGVLAPVDHARFPGMERQHETLWAWVQKNRDLFRWDGFFDHGAILIEFDNHGQRYSNGPANTWVWRDYAGWILNDGQLGHQIWRAFARSGDRRYARLAEAVTRNIGDETTVHFHNPQVPGAHPVGTAHRHDMLPWGAIVTTYGMDVLGSCDLWYFEADLRAREVLRDYAQNLALGGPGLKERHGMASLLYRISEALGDPALAEKAKGLVDGDLQEAAQPNFRSWTDLYMPMILAAEIAPDERLRKGLLDAADRLCAAANKYGSEVVAWAYVQTKDAKYLEGLKRCLALNGNIGAAAANSGDPWKEDWKVLRQRMEQMPAWYVKVYINTQIVCRYPSAIRALQAAGLDEKAAVK